MAEPTSDKNAAELRRGLADHIQSLGHLSDPLLYKAFATIPRHLFVPRFRHPEDGQWVTDTDPDWLATTYADLPLVTQVKPAQHDPHSAWPTCSSSMPSLMADMIEELDITPRTSVLEIGTGTGYNAAILCDYLGDHRVATIEIDPDLASEARERLTALGYHPSTAPTDRSYDRVLATHAVADIPYDWVRWSHPGAVILADLRSHNPASGVWARVIVSDDGTQATGRLLKPRGGFMNGRTVPEFADPGSQTRPLAEDAVLARWNQRQTRHTDLQPTVLEHPIVKLLVWRAIPDFSWWYTEERDVYGLGAADGSWANVHADGTVHHGGPTDLWKVVEDTRHAWETAGKPGLPDLTITVTRDGTSIALPI